jgi:hypothetical protein
MMGHSLPTSSHQQVVSALEGDRDQSSRISTLCTVSFADEHLDREGRTKAPNNPWMPPTIARSFPYTVPYTTAAMVHPALALIQKEYSATDRRPHVTWLSLSAGSFQDVVKGNMLITSLFKPQGDAASSPTRTQNQESRSAGGGGGGSLAGRKRTMMEAFLSRGATTESAVVTAEAAVVTAVTAETGVKDGRVAEDVGNEGGGRGACGEEEVLKVAGGTENEDGNGRGGGVDYNDDDGGRGGGGSNGGREGEGEVERREICQQGRDQQGDAGSGRVEGGGEGGGGGGRGGGAVYSADEIDESVLCEVRHHTTRDGATTPSSSA